MVYLITFDTDFSPLEFVTTATKSKVVPDL